MSHSWQIYRRFFGASVKEYLRDPLSTLFAFVLPLFFIFTFGITAKIINGNQQQFAVQVSVVGESHEAEALWQQLRNAPGLVVQRQLRSDPQSLVRDNEVQAAVSWDESHQRPTITTTESMRSVAQLVFAALTHQTADSSTPVEFVAVENQQFNYFTFIFPSLLTLALLQVALFGTATPLVAAREKGIYRYYAVIPLPRWILLASQVSVRLVISLIQIALLMVVGGLAFGFSVQHPLLFALLLVASALLLVSFGYALAGLFRSTTLATILLTLLNFWCMCFGQLFLDLSIFPPFKWLILTTPVGFVSDALRFAMNGSEGVFPFVANCAGMAVWGAITLFVGIRWFRFQPKQS